MKLVIGTGANWESSEHKKQGWIGIDILPAFHPDIVRDITKGLPFDSDKFDEILIEHVLEHIDNRDWEFVISEIHRVLAPGGIVRIEVPYWRDDIAVEAAGHVRFFCENSFMNYYDNPYWQEMGQVHFSECLQNELVESVRSAKQARVVKVVLKK
jgi:SAM-dependent methyltransferase